MGARLLRTMLFAELAAATEDVRAASGPARPRSSGSPPRCAGWRRRSGSAGAGISPARRGSGCSGVGWASLREDPPAPAETRADGGRGRRRVGGGRGACPAPARRPRGGRRWRAARAATASEQRFLRPLVGGELRQGALAAVVGDAVAQAAEVPETAVRRALMLRGDLGAVAAVALAGGDLAQFRLEVGRPIAPMLASTAPDVAGRAREDRAGRGRVEARRRADPGPPRGRRRRDLHAHARRRDAAVPEVVEAALGAAGDRRSCSTARRSRCARTGGRTRSRSRLRGSRAARASIPLTPMFFDLLQLDGEDLLDRPGSERAAALVSTGARPVARPARRGRGAAASGRWRRATRASS